MRSEESIPKLDKNENEEGNDAEYKSNDDEVNSLGLTNTIE